MRKLPVIQSFKEVYAGVTRHYFELIMVAPAGVTMILLGYAALIYSGFFPGLAAEEEHIWASATRLEIVLVSASWIAVLIGFISAAVRWHKFVLLGERPTGNGSILFFWEAGRRVISGRASS